MSAFRAEDFLNKGKLFLNRAMEPDEVRSEDERRLWASLALEVLAKWALAETSPTLVADPQRGDGEQLYMALGIREGGPYVSVTASTAFKRCAAIYHPFNDKAAIGFANARNEYLHGAELAILRLPNDAWWSRFWSLVNVLITAHGYTMYDVVGPAHVRAVEEHLRRNAKRITEQTAAAIAAAKRNMARRDSGTFSAREADLWNRHWLGRIGFTYSAEAECPACGDSGVLEADEADGKEVVYPDTEWVGNDEPYVEVTFTPGYFSCPNCHLILESFELVSEAGLEETVKIATEEPWYRESEYGND